MVRAGTVLAIGGMKDGPGRPLDEATQSGTLAVVAVEDGAIAQTLSRWPHRSGTAWPLMRAGFTWHWQMAA